jgi:23S rRNA-/tRNA-specific pseudouridylate synthase
MSSLPPLIDVSTHLWVVDKPSDLAVLEDRQSASNIWQQFSARGLKPFMVHRLDKGTSGVLLIARDQATQSLLTRAFSQRSIRKFYLAWVCGQFPAGTHTFDLPLCKGRKSRYRVAGAREAILMRNRTFTVTQDRPGVAATTRARCLKQTDGHSLLLLTPVTGRTHQLRVHLSWCGFPIVGDRLYGRPNRPEQAAARLMLHCHRLVVPEFGRFTATVPPDLCP